MQESVNQLMMIIGLDEAVARTQFSPETLLSISGGDVGSAVEMFFSTQGTAMLAELAPPEPASAPRAASATPAPAASTTASSTAAEPAAAPAPPADSTSFTAPTAIRLSCGHVETNLEPGALEEMATMLQFIRMGALPPAQVLDEDTREYTNNRFAVVLPSSVKWE